MNPPIRLTVCTYKVEEVVQANFGSGTSIGVIVCGLCSVRSYGRLIWFQKCNAGVGRHQKVEALVYLVQRSPAERRLRWHSLCYWVNCASSSEEIVDVTWHRRQMVSFALDNMNSAEYKAATSFLPIIFDRSSPGAAKFVYLKIADRLQELGLCCCVTVL